MIGKYVFTTRIFGELFENSRKNSQFVFCLSENFSLLIYIYLFPIFGNESQYN